MSNILLCTCTLCLASPVEAAPFHWSGSVQHTCYQELVLLSLLQVYLYLCQLKFSSLAPLRLWSTSFPHIKKDVEAFFQIILSQMQIVVLSCHTDKFMLWIYIKEHWQHKSLNLVLRLPLKTWFYFYSSALMNITCQMSVLMDPTPKYMKWVCKFCIISNLWSLVWSMVKYAEFHIITAESTSIILDYCYFSPHTYKNVLTTNNL